MSQSLYEKYVNPYWSQALRKLKISLVPVSSHGCYVTMKNGWNYLDFLGGFGTNILGYGNNQLIKKLAMQIGKISVNIFPFECSKEAGLLAKQLLSYSDNYYDKVFFASTGSEGVESAVKFALIHTRKHKIISFEGGFHGLSLATTMMAGNQLWREGIAWESVNFIKVSFGDLNQIKKYLAVGDVAAIVLEPICGSVTAKSWYQEQLNEIRSLCNTQGTLIIFDEVLCGIARSGAWFGYQAINLSYIADMVVVSKGLTGGMIPISAILMKESVFNSVFGRPGKAKIHGSTFGGNRLSLICALETLKIIKQLNLIQNAKCMGKLIIDKINSINKKNQEILYAQGIGLIISITLRAHIKKIYGSNLIFAIWYKLLEYKIITHIASQDNEVIRILPPLCVSYIEVELFINSLTCIINELLAE